MGSGSTIIARQSGDIYIPIIIAIGIAFVVFLIFLITKKISEHKKTPEYLAKQRDRTTKYKDIKKFAAKYNLTRSETNLLWEMCMEAHPKNILYLVQDNIAFDAFYKTEYENFKDRNVSDKKFSEFFQLRYKLEKAIAKTKKLSSTTNIPPNSIMFYVDQNGEQFPLTVLQNTKTSLSLEVPPFLMNMKPEELQRTRFMYKTITGMTYLFLARPIRYSKENGVNTMILAHSHDLVLQTQRQTKREFVNADCKFMSVKMESEDKQKIIYSDKLYPAKIVNVSAGGCCIHTTLPIKEKQLISVIYPDLHLDKNTIGVILHTGFIPSTRTYALHIQFIKIHTSVQNRIYAYVYKFEL